MSPHDFMRIEELYAHEKGWYRLHKRLVEVQKFMILNLEMGNTQYGSIMSMNPNQWFAWGQRYARLEVLIQRTGNRMEYWHREATISHKLGGNTCRQR